MKIIKKHFDGKTTYIVGNMIQNGCQTFHKDNADSVFDEFEVPQEIRDEVLSYCSDTEDWESVAKRDNYIVRILVASQGKCLETLVYDENWKVRRAVARQGFGFEELINDNHFLVRRVVAEQGYGLDKLINDESWDVRSEVKKQINLKNNI